MAVYRCKSCGGELNVQQGMSVVECDYCGIKQSVPTIDDENIQKLYNRANVLRIRGEFDKAEEFYEKILQTNEKEAEAYWGVLLCKYGIEYVEDPETFKRVPTCHRTSLCSIMSEGDYQSALLYADVIQKSLYEEEAKVIDEIQKGILKISKNEEPYDVFICYKETDENGERTVDSTIAYEIYTELTEVGLKVFYAAVTLEDKLGQEYEPYIFAAIKSARVMLVIGTKSEYFNAVWVKNEWSRFLKLMKDDNSKTLIPCYRDMEAYELPEEFVRLQAQDMAKIGFIIDVVRGIKKIVNWSEETSEEKELEKGTENPSIEPLLKRAYLFLEDKNWENAQEYCERVLDMDPENAQAYLYKLMAECYVQKMESLALCRSSFEKNNNYKKVLRFGDEKLRNTLMDYVRQINERNEEERLSNLYAKALEHMKCAKTSKEYEAARWEFAQIEKYKDSNVLAERCAKAAEKEREKELEYAKLKKAYDQAVDHMNRAKTAEDFDSVQWEFAQVENFEYSKELAEQCAERADAIRKFNIAKRNNEIYDDAQKKLESDQVESVQTAIAEFETISGWKDVNQKIIECHEKINHLNRQKKKRKRKIVKRIVMPFAIVFVILIWDYYVTEYKPGVNYAAALECIENEDFETAFKKLSMAIRYRNDASELMEEIAVIYTEQCIITGDYERLVEAAIIYEEHCIRTEEYENTIVMFEKANYIGEEYFRACYKVGKRNFDLDNQDGYIKAVYYFEKIESYDYEDANELLGIAREKLE